MIFKDFQNCKLATLGVGCMRLPIIDGDDAQVDLDATAEMVEYAMTHGANYFDTAWGYHAGNSEAAIGKILAHYPRESYFLADKFPGYDLSNMDKVQTIFEEQLKRCGVTYFDFYLFHNVCEINIDAYLDKQYGILDYLLDQKKNGRIRHLGFSAHGDLPVMKRFLAAYGEHMEFCQIQLNYIDWGLQNAKAKVELLDQYHLPIWAMEPLRGGQLASMPDQEMATLKALRPQESIPAWAFRFLQSIPQVTVVLSGMSNFAQLSTNIDTFAEEKPLNEQELAALLQIADRRVGEKTVSCTACRYCVSHCSQELDIPALLALYNEHCFTGGGFIAPMALSALPADKKPSACLHCQNCEAVCPQQLKISDAMTDFAANLAL